MPALSAFATPLTALRVHLDFTQGIFARLRPWRVGEDAHVATESGEIADIVHAAVASAGLVDRGPGGAADQRLDRVSGGVSGVPGKPDPRNRVALPQVDINPLFVGARVAGPARRGAAVRRMRCGGATLAPARIRGLAFGQGA